MHGKILLTVSAIVIFLFGALMPAQAAFGETMCLQYDDPYTSRVSINLATGVRHGSEIASLIDNTVAAGLSYTSPDVFVSPDQQHTVIQYATSRSASAFALLPAYTVGGHLNLGNDANDGLHHSDIVWSPDSQWISYLTFHEDDGYYLSLMDAFGHLRQTQLISTRFEDSVSSFGWSGDSRYVAVSVSDSIGGPLRKIEIFAAPDLALKRLIKFDFSIAGARYYWETYPDRIQWSSQGSQLAYFNYFDNGMDGGLTLNLYAVDTDQITTYDLPNIASKTSVGMAWSPDGQSLFVTSTEHTEERVGRIDVVRLNDPQVHTITQKAMHDVILADGGNGFPLLFWSADGHALLYVEQLPEGFHSLGALMAYIPATGETREVSPHIYMNPNPDVSGRYLFALSPDDGQNHNGYLDREVAPQTAETKDSLVVIDTNTLEQRSVPALRDFAHDLQITGKYSGVTGWLLLSEGGWMTWGINLFTGDQTPLYAPHALSNIYGESPYYMPVEDADYLIGFMVNGSKPAEVSLFSLRARSSRSINHTFSGSFHAIALSPDQHLVAALISTDTGYGALEVINEDGMLVGQFEDVDTRATHLAFTTCD